MNRRFATFAMLATPLLGAFGGRASAQPDRPVTIVVPFGPGGTTDMLGRLVAQQFAGPLGRAVLVENRPGAGSTVGAAHVARATPDGNTLLLASSTTLAINPSLYTKLPYDAQKDFAPIGMIAAVPLALVVHSALEVRSVADLVRASRRKAGGLSYASAGNGTPHHLAAELFKTATGADLRHVSYNGSAPALADVLKGHVDVMFCDLPPLLAQVEGKRIQVLGVTSAGRQSALPGVATLAESGTADLADFEVVAWQCLVAPAGTPQETLDRLSGLLAQMLTQTETRARLQRQGVEPRTESPDRLTAYIRAETVRWEKIIRTAGITAS